MPCSQYCSNPSPQAAQCRQLPTMQPTPTVSPMRKPITSLPTALTWPTISCPGTQGYSVPAHSARTVCKSEWQMPQ